MQLHVKLVFKFASKLKTELPAEQNEPRLNCIPRLKQSPEGNEHFGLQFKEYASQHQRNHTISLGESLKIKTKEIIKE